MVQEALPVLLGEHQTLFSIIDIKIHADEVVPNKLDVKINSKV
jgi:hypothetical protein